MRSRTLAFTILISASCRDHAERPPPSPPAEPIRGAAGDEDLRVMLAELAERRGCDVMKGQFRALRDKARPDVVTGIMWIRGCRMHRRGTAITLELATNGWQWIETAKDKAGATFEVAQDVRFVADMSIPGGFDVAYSPATHVASLWFSPSKRPVVRFAPIGEIAVEEQSAWARAVGALGTLVGQSPERQAEAEADVEGTGEMASQLAHGLGATLDLCTGHVRFELGRPGKGKMYPPGVGESKQAPVEIHPGGLVVFGPFLAPEGFNAHLDVDAGTVRAALMCRGEAEKVAAAFVDGAPIPDVKPLAVTDLDGASTLHIGRARCKVSLVVRPIPDATGGPARFRWWRTTKEWGEASGGPLALCRGTPSSG